MSYTTNMKNLFSATKIVFILTAVAVCVAFYVGKIPVEQFMPLATMVFSAYYVKNSVDKPVDKNA